MNDPALPSLWPEIDAPFLEHLLVTLSHQLRTPLTVAKGQAMTLRRAYRRLKQDEREEMLDAMVHACDRLERTIQHLQLTAQLLQQRVVVHRTESDLLSLTQQALQNLADLHDPEPLQAVSLVIYC